MANESRCDLRFDSQTQSREFTSSMAGTLAVAWERKKVFLIREDPLKGKKIKKDPTNKLKSHSADDDDAHGAQ